MTELCATNYQSPIGEMLVIGTHEKCCGMYFHGQRYYPELRSDWVWNDAPLRQYTRLLDRYFDGKGDPDKTIALSLDGTPFQKRVWDELRMIPSGETRSYGDIARSIGAESAVRAVGAAIGRNPVSVLVPCHRVISSTGKLTGYAGGLERKEWLLAHETGTS